MSGKALNKQEMDSIDLAKFVFAFAVIHIQSEIRKASAQGPIKADDGDRRQKTYKKYEQFF